MSGGREAVCFDERGVDVVKDVGPDLTDIVHLIELGNGRVAEGVGGGRGRVGVSANTGGVIDDILAHHVVGDRCIFVLGPSAMVSGQHVRHVNVERKPTQRKRQTSLHPYRQPRWFGGSDQCRHQSSG